MSAKQQYLVVRPFVAINSEGNCITVEARDVWAYPPEDAWVRGEDASQQFGVLASVFALSTVPVVRSTRKKLHFHPDLLAGRSPRVPGRPRATRPDSNHCPRCFSKDVRPSQRHARAASLWTVICTRPFRCRTCDEKFLRFRWQA